MLSKKVKTHQLPQAGHNLLFFSMSSEFTQQTTEKGGRQNTCVTNVTGLLLACSEVIFTKYQCFLVFYKKDGLKEDEV